MTNFDITPEARHPFYPGAMSLLEVRAGTQFITLDIHRGSFVLTALASEWRAEVVPIISSHKLPLSSVVRLLANDVNDDTIDLCEQGIHPPVEASKLWNPRRLSVLADRESILTFYPWLVKKGFSRAANEVEDTFFEFFVDPEVYWSQLMQN